MKYSKFILLFVLGVFLFTASFSQSGYLKIGDIKGESEARDHKDWIIIESFAYKIATNNNPASGRVIKSASTFEDLIIRKKLDKASPVLMMKCAAGEVMPELELELSGADGKAYYKIKLSEVRVTNISISASGQPQNEMMEEVSFNYSKISWEYIDKKGGVNRAGYDLKLNKKV